VTQAVLAGWRTAPIDDKLKAMLGYLEKLTLSPEAVQPADVAALRAVGIEKQAMLEAIYVCALFNIVDRLADALNFEFPPSFIGGAKVLLKRGYEV
jgi:alkylhydroperoxidase family enzyme